MSQCNSSSTCCSNENDCQSTASASSPCPCPIEFAVEKWSDAFFRAVTELQAELMKERIQRQYGAQMEAIADAVVEEMGIQWQSMLTQAKSRADLREKIKEISLSNGK